MKKSLVSLLTICVLILGLLTGCGGTKVTAESLLKEVQTKSEAMNSMETHLTMAMTMGSADLGGSIDLTMEMDMQTVIEPVASYMTGTLSMMGINLDMEIYTILEDEQIATYMGMMGEWMVQKMAYDTESVNQLDTTAGEMLQNLGSLALAEETEDVDGTEAYIITGTLSGEDMQSMMDSAESMMSSVTGDTEALDMSGVTVDFKYAISKADKLPLYMDMTFTGFDSVMEGQDVSIDDFTMRMEYTGFDTIESITVPQEVIDQAVEM